MRDVAVRRGRSPSLATKNYPVACAGKRGLLAACRGQGRCAGAQTLVCPSYYPSCHWHSSARQLQLAPRARARAQARRCPCHQRRRPCLSSSSSSLFAASGPEGDLGSLRPPAARPEGCPPCGKRSPSKVLQPFHFRELARRSSRSGMCEYRQDSSFRRTSRSIALGRGPRKMTRWPLRKALAASEQLQLPQAMLPEPYPASFSCPRPHPRSRAPGRHWQAGLATTRQTAAGVAKAAEPARSGRAAPRVLQERIPRRPGKC